MVADVTFDAEDIDDAMVQLAWYFLSLAASVENKPSLFESGELEVTPVTQMQSGYSTEVSS
jgi:hypothetical protein